MKKLVFWSVIITITGFSMLISCNPGQNKKAEEPEIINTNDQIKVLYFHFTRRCATCNAVEKETEKALADLYPNHIESGKISFESVNLDLKAGKQSGEKYGINSQTLVVIGGQNKMDITTDGFMYALTKPDKLKETIKQTIEPIL